jgi:hypothetical protein
MLLVAPFQGAAAYIVGEMVVTTPLLVVKLHRREEAPLNALFRHW